MNTTITFNQKQQLAYDRVTLNKKSVLLPCRAGTGKEAPISEPVLTPNGWSTMGQLRPDDYVIGSSGLPIKVLSIHPQGIKDVYTVETTDGIKIRCGQEHLWSVWVLGHRKQVLITKTTQELINGGVRKSNNDPRYTLPKFDGLQQGKCIDYAYALGYCLGNACFSLGQLQVSYDSRIEYELLPLLESCLGKPNISRVEGNYAGRSNYAWVNIHSEIAKYRDSGLSKDKYLHSDHINWLLWDYNSRLELLQGLLDSDGTVGAGSKDGRQRSNFCSTSINLLLLIRDLVRSLGGRACEPYKENRSKQYKSGYCGQIAFRMPVCPFKLKSDKWKLGTFSMQSSISKITKEDYQEESVCIRVDAADSLYVTTGFKLTHNTFLVTEMQKALVQEGYTILNTSYTAKSASLLPGGSTIGRVSGMRRGVDDVLPEGIREDHMWNGTKRIGINSIIHKADKRINSRLLAIVIDEISQLSSENLYLFYQIVMKSRQLHQVSDTEPLFIIVGDFGQLPCISGNLSFKPAIFEYWKAGMQKQTVTYDTVLNSINPEVIVLDEVVRQADPKYIRALKWCYYGIAAHPALLNRFDVDTPLETSRIYFNNREVITENERHLERFLNNNPDALCRTYTAASSTLTDSEVKHLSPVSNSMTVFVGFPFSVTINVPDPSDKKKLLVANGEVVTVVGLGQKFITVIKKNGQTVELYYTQHRLPVDSNGNSSTFLQLPGYPGESSSLYKFQGETCDIPMEFAAWQWWGKKRISLKNQAGAIYVMCSRNTRLEDLYFDTSFGVEEAKRLFREAIGVNPDALNYLLKGKPPLWKTDSNQKFIVVELEKVSPETINGYTFYTIWYTTTLIKTGEEICYCLRFYLTEDSLQLISAAYLDNLEELTGIDVSELNYSSFYTDLAQVWLKYYYK